MAAAFSIYDFDQYVITYNGIIIDGFADGTALTIAPEADAYEDLVGVDGRVSRSKTLDNRWTATINLLQTSTANELLSALLMADLNAPNGAGVGAFIVKDVQGSTLFVGAEAWIKRPPDITLERNASTRTWIIRIAQGLVYIAGS